GRLILPRRPRLAYSSALEPGDEEPHTMMRKGFAIAAGLGLLALGTVTGPLTSLAAQQRAAATNVNWALHNLDLAGTRFSPLDQINTGNVKSLVPRWLFQYGVIDGVSNQTTPVVVDGVMYVTDPRGSVYAVDAMDGHLLWSYD